MRVNQTGSNGPIPSEFMVQKEWVTNLKKKFLGSSPMVTEGTKKKRGKGDFRPAGRNGGKMCFNAFCS